MGLLSILKDKGHKIFDRPYELNIVAWRSKNRVANQFDDYLYVCYRDYGSRWVYHTWQITTDPGTKSLKFPVNSKGTAILCPGQYLNSHQIGLHQGKYEALTQLSPVTVYRDNNKDNYLNLDPNRVFTGMFGINIHKAGLDSTLVENFSAGCCVFKRAKDFNELLLLAKKHRKLYGNTFTLTLINE